MSGSDLKTWFADFLNRNRDILVQTLTALAVRVLGALGTFFLGFIVARNLGANEAGLYFLIFSVLTFASVCSRVGYDYVVVRFVSSGQYEPFHVLITALCIVVPSSILMSLVLKFSAGFIADVWSKPDIKVLLELSVSFIPMVSFYTIGAMYFQGLKRSSLSVFFLNVVLPFTLISFMLFLSVDDVRDVVFFLNLSGCFSALLLFFFIMKTKKEIVSFRFVSGMFDSSKALFIFAVLSQLVQVGPYFVSGYFLDSASLAVLSVAQRLAFMISFVLMAVNMVVSPRFSKLHSTGDYAGIRKLYKISVFMMLLFCVPIFIVVVCFSNEIMSVFGVEFSGYGLILIVVCVGQLINAATGPVGFLLVMSGHENKIRDSSIINAPMIIGLSLLLIWNFGLFGAAVSMMLGVSLQNIFVGLKVRSTLGFNPFTVWKL